LFPSRVTTRLQAHALHRWVARCSFVSQSSTGEELSFSSFQSVKLIEISA
jgi:hypothetical protein